MRTSHGYADVVLLQPRVMASCAEMVKLAGNSACAVTQGPKWL